MNGIIDEGESGKQLKQVNCGPRWLAPTGLARFQYVDFAESTRLESVDYRTMTIERPQSALPMAYVLDEMIIFH